MIDGPVATSRPGAGDDAKRFELLGGRSGAPRGVIARADGNTRAACMRLAARPYLALVAMLCIACMLLVLSWLGLSLRAADRTRHTAMSGQHAARTAATRAQHQVAHLTAALNSIRHQLGQQTAALKRAEHQLAQSNARAQPPSRAPAHPRQATFKEWAPVSTQTDEPTIELQLAYPDGQLRLRAPSDIPLQELLAEFLEVCEQPDSDDWTLSADGTNPYPTERSLDELGVSDGAHLVLAPHPPTDQPAQPDLDDLHDDRGGGSEGSDRRRRRSSSPVEAAGDPHAARPGTARRARTASRWPTRPYGRSPNGCPDRSGSQRRSGSSALPKTNPPGR